MSTVNAELKLTKKRLRNLRARRLGLQQLAVREISKQLTFYRTHPDELEKLKGLPGVLREKILQVLMKKRCLDEQGQEMEFENLLKIFPLLLSARTRYIELNGILSFYPDRYKDGKVKKVTRWFVKLLKQIETRAPQVETLVMKRSKPFYVEGPCSSVEQLEFNQEMVQLLMKMQNLNRLNVSLYLFRLTDLLKLCKNNSRLQYVNVEFLNHKKGTDKPSRKKVSSSFCNLKELIFEYPSFEWLGVLCTKVLPNIEVVQYDPNKIMELVGIRKHKNARYQGLKFPGASNLRQIFMDMLLDYSTVIVEDMPTLFPKVTCLMVNHAGYFPDKDVMPKFDNIRNLHLLNPCESEDYEKYLDAYGKNLQSLYLGHDSISTEIDLETIFKCSPKLEKLSLLNVSLKTPTSKTGFFAELKELEWAFNNYKFYSYGGTFHTPFVELSDILSAPKLEKVKLEVGLIYEDDLLLLNSLIRENRILNNLHTLHVFFTFQIPNDGVLRSLANVLKSACAFLPKLTDFKVGNRYRCNDPRRGCQPTPICLFDECVYEMVRVFENENYC